MSPKKIRQAHIEKMLTYPVNGNKLRSPEEYLEEFEKKREDLYEKLL